MGENLWFWLQCKIHAGSRLAGTRNTVKLSTNHSSMLISHVSWAIKPRETNVEHSRVYELLQYTRWVEIMDCGLKFCLLSHPFYNPSQVVLDTEARQSSRFLPCPDWDHFGFTSILWTVFAVKYMTDGGMLNQGILMQDKRLENQACATWWN